jgi:hypothetical protein
MVPWRKDMFCSVEGTVTSEQFVAQQKSKVDSGGKRRYFCDDGQVIHALGRTYALSNQWGNRTLEAIRNILGKFSTNGVTVDDHSMPSCRQVDAILPFIDRFEADGFSPGSWDSAALMYNFSDSVTEFHQALYSNGWISPSFDWGEWLDTAREYVESPEKIASADIKAIQKLLTSHVRAERFCEGTLAQMFENGHIVALLRRLRELRRTMGN